MLSNFFEDGIEELVAKVQLAELDRLNLLTIIDAGGCKKCGSTVWAVPPHGNRKLRWPDLEDAEYVFVCNHYRCENQANPTTHKPEWLAMPGWNETTPFPSDMNYHNSFQRGPALIKWAMSYASDSEEVWPKIREYWSGFDLLNHEEWENVFYEHEGSWSPEHEDKSAQEMYDALPDTLTVYRGQCRSRGIGVSWTVSTDIAKRFSHGFRGIPFADPTVFQTTIRKEDIAFCVTDRDEKEVVLKHVPDLDELDVWTDPSPEKDD